MILSKEVETPTNNRNYSTFKSLGYVFNIGDNIIVDIDHLSVNSKSVVFVSCDICDYKKSIRYCDYRKNIKKYNIYTCSRKCANFKFKKTNIEKYGCEYPLQNFKIKKELKTYFNKKYGGHPSKLEIFEEKKQNTNLKRYGVRHQMEISENIDKIKNTKLEKYGNDKYNNLEKMINTCIDKYGVDNPMKYYKFYKKQKISSFKNSFDERSALNYQGTYELDFINYCLSKNIKIKEGLIINYNIYNKDRVYYSDFYLPDYNLICEVKSSYTFEANYIKNIAKKEYSINSGYNFLFLIDKDYNELEKIINNNEYATI